MTKLQAQSGRGATSSLSPESEVRARRAHPSSFRSGGAKPGPGSRTSAPSDRLIVVAGSPVLLRSSTQFPCHYIEGQMRSVELALPPNDITPFAEFGELVSVGFKRNGFFVTKNACLSCRACSPLRIDLSQCVLSRTQRKIARRNSELSLHVMRAVPLHESFDLYRRYHLARHPGGEQAHDGYSQYAALIRSFGASFMAEFRDQEGALVLVSLFEVLADGIYAHQSWFAPERGQESLGTYNVLWLLYAAWRQQKKYLYLGDWIANHPNLRYKTNFRGTQRYDGKHWVDVDQSRSAKT